MQLKLTTDYALRMLVYLIIKGGVANSKEISERLDLPQKNVLSIGRKLKKEKVVTILNGPYGGYLMNRQSQGLLLYDIVSLFEDVKVNGREVGKGSHTAVNAVISSIYGELQGLIEGALRAHTLADWVSGCANPPA